MVCTKGWAAVGLLVLFFSPSSAFSAVSTDTVVDSAVVWAYGTVVDSITVTGNKDTKGYVVLREMETRPGDVLEPAIFRRDVRFITDLTPFASVNVRADSLSPGHCAIRIHVTERPGLLIKSVLPVLKYDFETGINYGVRWTDKNFRGRLEQLTFQYQRNEHDDDSASFSWFAPWLGWRHIGLGARIAYFNRGDPEPNIAVLERLSTSVFLSLPLTDSRIRFSNVSTTLSVIQARNGAPGQPTDNQLTLSPSLGYTFDSRDSGLRPVHGSRFSAVLFANYPLREERLPHYSFTNEMRGFMPWRRGLVLAGLHNITYQFGDFPDYSTISLGGAGTLRGHPTRRFSGSHRWIQTVELRYLFLPKKVFWVPFFKYIDIGLGAVTFIDAGIVWTGSDSFNLENYHGTGGVGLRIYSPIRDVVRIDFGFDRNGNSRLHLSTGPRF